MTSWNVPRQLAVLAGSWAECVVWLDTAIAPVVPLPAPDLPNGPLDRVIAQAHRELDALSSWIDRVVAWIEGPLAVTLESPATDEATMRRVAGRFTHFAAELVERRDGLRRLACDPGMRALAARLDAVHRSLLEQFRDFAVRVVDAVEDVQAAAEGAISPAPALSFCFCPDIAKEGADLTRWLRDFEPARPDPPVVRIASGIPDPPEAPPATGSSPIAAQVVGVVALLAMLGVVLAMGWGGVLLLLAVALVAFVLRHPLLALLAILIGLG